MHLLACARMRGRVRAQAACAQEDRFLPARVHARTRARVSVRKHTCTPTKASHVHASVLGGLTRRRPASTTSRAASGVFKARPEHCHAILCVRGGEEYVHDVWNKGWSR